MSERMTVRELMEILKDEYPEAIVRIKGEYDCFDVDERIRTLACLGDRGRRTLYVETSQARGLDRQSGDWSPLELPAGLGRG